MTMTTREMRLRRRRREAQSLRDLAARYEAQSRELGSGPVLPFPLGGLCYEVRRFAPEFGSPLLKFLFDPGVGCGDYPPYWWGPPLSDIYVPVSVRRTAAHERATALGLLAAMVERP